MATDSPEKYPRREKHFAYRYCRLLTKTCAAQELGPDCCWLLAVIALLEDAKRYSDAITFYNDQLMAVAGFTRRHTMIAVRSRAIDAGWLHYEQGGKRKAGRYWVTIPTCFRGIPDGSCDEGDSSSDAASDDGNDIATSIISYDAKRTQSGLKASSKADSKRHSSYPSPSPIPPPPTPSPIAASVSSAQEGGGGGFDSWQEAEREIRKLGVAKAAEAISGARSIGMTMESVRLVVREWQDARPAYDVGALYWRLVRGVWPERSGNGQEEKWVQQEKLQTQRVLAALGERPKIDPAELSLKEQLARNMQETEEGA